MSAYLVAFFAPSVAKGGAVLLGLEILSEETPTVDASRRTACILRWPGETYAEAKIGLLVHLTKTAPWLLPARNGGSS